MPPATYSAGEKLLLVLSCKREVSWPVFRRITDHLLTETREATPDRSAPNYRPYQLLRLLDSLGHCDFSFSSTVRRIVVAPPMLVRLPLAGAPKAVLAGARSASTQTELQQAVERFSDKIAVERSSGHPDGLSPNRVLVESTSSAELTALAEQFGVLYSPVPPAWAVMNCAGGIDEYRNTLVWEKAETLNWACRVFDHEAGRFLLDADDPSASFASYTDPMNNMRVHFYRKDGMQAEVDRDWGRYLVFQDNQKSVLFYDERKCVLGVPARYPLPRLFARALTLCSGFVAMPRAQNNDQSGLRYFRYVPKQIADLMARKLSQPLNAFSHDFPESGGS